MLRRISTVVAVVAVGSATLVTVPAASAAVGAPESPSITRVVVQPSPVVVPGKEKVTVTFSFDTGGNATTAEAYLRPPAPSVETKIELTRQNLGFGKARWTARTQFDRSAKAGKWNLRVFAKNSGGEKSAFADFEVRQVWETEFQGFAARPREVRSGDPVVLGGTLRVNSEKGWQALAGERVHIAFRPFGGRSWKRIDATRTGRDGRFTERVRATEAGWYRAEYDGSRTTHPAKSDGDVVRVKRRDLDTRIARFGVTPRSVKKGEKVTAAGVLLAEDGRDLERVRGERVDILFLPKGSKRWQRVGADRTDRSGRFAEEFTAEAPGWWRAVFAGGRGLKGSSSRPAFVDVTRAKATTRIAGFDASPEPVRFRRFLKVKGQLQVFDGGREVQSGRRTLKLFFRADGSGEWRLVRTLRTDAVGSFWERVRAHRSGWWRVEFPGDEATEGSVSRADHVRVIRRR